MKSFQYSRSIAYKEFRIYQGVALFVGQTPYIKIDKHRIRK